MSNPLHIMVDVPPERGYYRNVIAGAARYCREHPGVRLRMPTSEWDLIEESERIDGTIALISDSRLPSEKARARPLVNISSVSMPVAFPTITIDSHAIGKMAAEHLLGQGYRHFACHIESRVWFSPQRLKGFADRLAEASHSCAVFDTAPSRACQESATATLRDRTMQWLRDLPKPLGLFTHNEGRAEMLIDICRDAGLAVGDEVGVIAGDNDDLIASASSPTLTCIDTSADDVGYRAMQMVLYLIEGRPAPLEPIFVPPRRVIQRESTQMVVTDDELLSRALAYIRQHATDPISIDDVLNYVPISRRALERRFRERLARSPGDEIRRVQIDKAQRMLSETDQSLKSIARASGYTQFRNFASAFRRQTGMGPTAYRRQFRAH